MFEQRTEEAPAITAASAEVQPRGCPHFESISSETCAICKLLAEKVAQLVTYEKEIARLRAELGAVHDSAEKLARRCIQAARGSR